MAKWIKWEGGRCPVATGTVVDVRYRDGRVIEYVKAGIYVDGMPRDAGPDFWDNEGFCNDIIAYRVHPTDENPITHKALAKLHAKLDRIERKIDAMMQPRDWGIKPAVMRPKWMDTFCLDRARVALETGYKGGVLAESFRWCDTDEGVMFWPIEDNNLRMGKPLSESARSALTRMIAEYEAATADSNEAADSKEHN